MAWALVTERAFDRAFKKLDRPLARRIAIALKGLAELDDPRTRLKPLQHSMAGAWRLRVGDYRVILALRNEELVIVALDLGHRSAIYD